MPVESDGSMEPRFPGQCERSRGRRPAALVLVPRLGDPVLPEPPCTASAPMGPHPGWRPGLLPLLFCPGSTC